MSENEIEKLTEEILQLKEDNNSILIGKELLKLKQLLQHGEYSTYVKANFGFSIRSAQRYVKSYQEKYYITNEKYLAYSMVYLGFQFNEDEAETYSFENTPEFKMALNNLLQLKKDFNYKNQKITK